MRPYDLPELRTEVRETWDSPGRAHSSGSSPGSASRDPSTSGATRTSGRLRRGFRSPTGLWSDGSSSSRQVQANAEANQAGQNQVDGHEVAQQPWNNQDEYSKPDRNDCMQVSDTDVHGSILLGSGVSDA